MLSYRRAPGNYQIPLRVKILHNTAVVVIAIQSWRAGLPSPLISCTLDYNARSMIPLSHAGLDKREEQRFLSATI